MSESPAALRVLQLVQQPALRGAEVFAKQLSAALRERGHVTRTVYLYSSPESLLPLEPDDIVLDAPPRHPLERVGVNPVVALRLGRVIGGFEPDIVQLNGGRTVKYGAALGHLVRGRTWAIVYRNIGDPNYWVRGPFKRFAYSIGVFGSVDGIISLSEGSSAAFRDKFGVRAPLEVVPNGVSPTSLQPMRDRAPVRLELGTSPTAPVVLYVGNLSPEKRVDRLLAGFSRARAQAPEARLWILGEGQERSSLDRAIERLGLETCVVFVGQTQDVASYYAAADVFALTSDTEGIPGVLLEAAFLGLPIVATDVGLVRECVLDGESALLARPNEVSVGVALGRLLRDEGLRGRLGACGRQFVRERFMMSDIAGRYERFYRRILERLRNPGQA
jgi:glycosyltransferase involved in cell wall biosynthesis